MACTAGKRLSHCEGRGGHKERRSGRCAFGPRGFNPLGASLERFEEGRKHLCPVPCSPYDQTDDLYFCFMDGRAKQQDLLQLASSLSQWAGLVVVKRFITEQFRAKTFFMPANKCSFAKLQITMLYFFIIIIIT